MSINLEIEPRSLRTAAKGLEEAGQRLSEQWEALKTAVAGMGEPWGGDDIGMLIGVSYTAIEASADKSYSGAVENLTAYAEKLNKMADNHEQAEQDNTAAVSSISAALNGG